MHESSVNDLENYPNDKTLINQMFLNHSRKMKYYRLKKEQS